MELSVSDDPLTRKLNKILETSLDTDEETLDALTDLSTFFVENSLQSRRNLRSQIEKRSLAINENFLGSFRLVKTSLDDICDDIAVMANSVSNMKKQLECTQEQTFELIQKTNSLQEESNKLKVQQQIAGAFLSRFQLSISEHQVLYGKTRDAPITSDFFTVLDRVQAIHADCRILMQSNYQTAALDIMEEMTLHQEGALERCYRWTQNHCRNIDTNDIGVLVMQAMSRLQDRPVLFKYVIDEYATSRRSVLVRSFIDALTVGGPAGNPKPIEMHAHDPKRYIGDIFAWLHQAIPSEKDNLAMMVKMCDKNDLTDQLALALANISDGVCHPLRVRVDTILSSERSTITLFSVANLIRFYQNIIKSVVQGGALEQCLIDLQGNSEASYLNSLALEVKTLLQRPMGTAGNLEVLDTNLMPPKSVGVALNILKEILSVASMVEGRQADIAKIVSTVIDPLLQSVTESASHLPTVDMAVYLLNCLYQMQSTLSMYEYMDERIERMQAASDAQIDTLTSEQASALVANLHLGPLYTLLQSASSNIEAKNLNVFKDKFDEFLSMPDVLLIPQINLLQSGTHRGTVRKRSFDVIAAIYKQLYERVIQDSQKAGQEVLGIHVFTKSPEAVAAMLATP